MFCTYDVQVPSGNSNTLRQQAGSLCLPWSMLSMGDANSVAHEVHKKCRYGDAKTVHNDIKKALGAGPAGLWNLSESDTTSNNYSSFKSTSSTNRDDNSNSNNNNNFNHIKSIVIITITTIIVIIIILTTMIVLIILIMITTIIVTRLAMNNNFTLPNNRHGVCLLFGLFRLQVRFEHKAPYTEGSMQELHITKQVASRACLLLRRFSMVRVIRSK